MKNLLLAVISAAAALLLVLSPMALVRGVNTMLVPYHHQEIWFVQICVVVSFISGLLGFRPAAGIKEKKEQRIVVWGLAGFIYLYIACAVLCERLKICVTFGFVRDIGLVLLVAGCLMRLWAILVLGRFHSAFVALMDNHKLIQSGPYKLLRHPSYLGMLIAMAGIPLIFGTWFPLLAMPGAFIAIKWRMNDEEDFLAENFGEEYEDYRQNSWRLIPFIY